MPRKFKTMDANEAVANVAYRASEVIAIYPITPSSPWGAGRSLPAKSNGRTRMRSNATCTYIPTDLKLTAADVVLRDR
jgi:hypothetical protein